MYRNSYYHRKDKKIYLRTWNEDGRRVTIGVPFKPYLYVKSAQECDAVSLFNEKVRKMVFEDTVERKEFLLRTEIKETYENLPPSQQFLIDKYWETNENPDFGKRQLRVGFFDIECLSKQMPNSRNPVDPISLITIYDSYEKKYHTFGYKDVDGGIVPRDENGNIVVDPKDIIYKNCQNEQLMMLEFLKHVNELDYDVFVGWNSVGFDMPYIVQRGRSIIGDRINALSPYRWIAQNEKEGRFGQKLDVFTPMGRSSIDYMEAYRKFNQNLKESYKLDSIAADEKIGIRKKDYGEMSLHEFQVTDWKGFVEYNIIDTLIVVRLDEKLRYMSLLQELSYIGLSNIEEGMKTLPIVNGAFAVKCRHMGKVLPTFERPHREGKNAGAYVADPRRGFVKAMVTLDFTSLYPSAAMSMNLSPETKLGRIISENASHYEFKKRDGSTKLIELKKLDEFIKHNHLIKTAHNCLFTGDKKGIVRDLLEVYFEFRKKYKNIMLKKEAELAELEKKYGDESEVTDEEILNKMRELDFEARFNDTKQLALKTFLNSVYGYFGNKFAPLGDDDIANSITLTCQFVIKEAGKVAYEWVCMNSKNIPRYRDVIIYGDTDSIHVSIDSVLEAKGITLTQSDGSINPQVFDIMKGLRTEVNTRIGEWAVNTLNSPSNRFDIKAEKIVSGALYNEKKKYCLRVLWNEGVLKEEFKYTGLDVVKSTVPKTIKTMMKDFTNEMIVAQSYTVSNNRLLEIYEKMKRMEVSQIAINSGIRNVDAWADKCDGLQFGKNTPWHVKASLAYNHIIKELDILDKYEPILSGDKVRLVYVKPNRYGLRTIAFKNRWPSEFDAIFEVDKDIMFEKLVYSYAARLYYSVDWPIRKPHLQFKENLDDVFSRLFGTAELSSSEVLPDIVDTSDIDQLMDDDDVSSRLSEEEETFNSFE